MLTVNKSSYQLSPIQQGMLFAHLKSKEPGVNIEQMICSLHEGLNVLTFTQAWQRVVERHPILRTSFDWRDLDEPLQTVHPQVQLLIEQQDWRHLSASEQEDKLQTYLQADRERGFDLTKAPLMRLALFQLAESDYKLVWTFHHILLDGRSLQILLKEVFAFYEAFCQGEDLQLEQTRPYSDYIDWLQQQDVSKAEAFWKQTLSGFSAPTPLVAERAASAGHSQELGHGQEQLQLSEAVTSALKSLAQEHELTLNTLVNGAWALLLSRYSGEEDVVFGATRACRQSALEGAQCRVGLFINTVPLRVRVSPELSVLSLLKELQSQWIALQDYEHTSLTKVQEWSGISDGTALFESILVFEDNPIDATLQVQGSYWENREFQLLEQTSFPLRIVACDSTKLLLTIEYHPQRCEQATIVAILDQFQHLLEQVVEHPEERIANFSLVTPKAKLILPNPAQTLCPVQAQPQYELVTTLFTDWVNRTPEHPALCQGDRSLTYAQLDRSAHALAQILLADGVERGDVVAVFGSRSFGLIASTIGVFLSGGVLLTIDQNLPLQRQQLMLEAAKVKSLFYIGEDKRPEDEWLSESLAIIQVDPDTGRAINAPEVAKNSEALSLPELSLDDAAYIFFTSGTTGVPKGVLGCHKGLSHFLTWQRQTFAVGSQDRSAQLTGLSFDVVLRDIFLPLTSGATLCLPVLENHLEPTRILPWLESEQISLLHTVPSLAQSWLLKVPPGISLRSLRWVFFAGEPLQETLIRQWREAFPNSGEIANFYGPTETTLAKFCYQVPHNLRPGVQPVGWPQPETQGLILGKNNQLCGIGEAGEIVIRTPFRSLGYINASEESQRRFVPNPFRDDPQDLLYHTGDRGRYRPDGSLEILGRIDNQVKIRGVRIEPGEIETVLDRHPGVRTTVVIAREDVPGDKRLVAYVVADREQIPTTTELRNFLKERLPIYMVPSAFVMLEALPLTPNGKVDRRALPAQDWTRRDLEETFVAPRTPVEKILADIWAEVLGLEKVGIHDNLFELGGHSLLATQILGRVSEALQVNLSLRDLFEKPTVIDLSKHIEFSESKNQSQQIPPLQPVERDRDLPLSINQERLWFLDQLEGNNAAYHLTRNLHFIGTLDIAVLEQSLTEIVWRHESLRTTFLAVNGSPVQAIAPASSMTLPIVDLQHLLEEEQTVEVQRLATEEAQRPFDLKLGPLMRVTLLHLGEENHILLVTIHHIISDGWSKGLFFQELSTLYGAFSKGEPLPLPELNIQYADFAYWQRQYLQGETLETQLNYWKQQLAGAPARLELPIDRPRPPVQTFRGGTECFVLDRELTRKLKTLSQRSGATLYMTLLAAFVTLLSRYSSQEDIVIGSPIANRNSSETESLIGFFVNTLVLRTDLQGNPTFQELLGRVRQITLEAYAHPYVPFEQLSEAFGIERNLSHSLWFQVMFVLENFPIRKLELPGVSITPLETNIAASMFDLTLSMEETEQGLQGNLIYNTDLFDTARIARMAQHFQVLLAGIVANPDRPLSELPLLTEAERHQLLVEWNRTQAESPHNLCIHQLFADRAERTPEAVAVALEDQQLTYQELNCRANQLAHHLQSLGVGPEVLVGLYVERSLEIVVGLLAILKAGGAYVPLDPAYPKERLAHILSDSQVSVLLTQEQLLPRLPEQQAHVVCLDTDWERIAQESQENPLSNVSPENLAYLIYTSGSTGKPKGVMIQHQSLVSFTQTATVEYGISGSDRVLQFASISFDAAAEEIYPCLTSGGILVLRTDEMLSDLQTFLQKCQDWKLTVLDLPTAYWHQVTSELAVTDLVLPESLRLVIIGGERVLPERVQLWQKVVGAYPQLVNTYGPTEATVVATMYKLPASASEDTALSEMPIGRTLSHVQAYVLDKYLKPVPIGVPGELHIGGISLARGYLNRPELTTQKFIPNPFSNQPDARLYKTGDIARYLPDGNIEFIGRIDNQVKIRGFRIELGEIEAVLSQHPQVKEAIVIAREDQPGNKRLVAYLVSNSEQAITEELRSFLKTKLPNYMVPSAFVQLDKLPLTPNGKVDRRALPAPDLTNREAENTFVHPRNELEEQLTLIWEQVLGVKPIGIKDNFFDLGGHSLLSIRLLNEIEKALNIKIPVVALFQLATVEQIANFLQDQNRSAGIPPEEQIFDLPTTTELSNALYSSGLTPEEYKALLAIVVGRKGKRPRENSLMVAINEQGVKPPLFFCANSPEEVLPLAKHLGNEQPFYLLESGLAVTGNVEDKIKAIASHHVKDILAVQPEPPYLLGGYCFGALVAYEIAQQLLAKGKRVNLLFFIERSGDHPNYKLYGDFVYFITDHWNHLAPLRFGDRLRYIHENLKRLISKRLPKPTDGQKSQLSYTPQPYPGKVILFCGIPNRREPMPPGRFIPIIPEEFTLFFFRRAGWDKCIVPDLEIYRVPGDHVSMREEPRVQVMAEKLKACIDKAVIKVHPINLTDRTSKS